MQKLVFIMFAFFILASIAEADTVYTVKKGDNLYKISKKYNIAVSELREVNNLSSNHLKPGMILTIPSTPSTIQKNRDLIKSQNIAESDKIYHTVKKGDTLYSIARTYSISIKDLRKLNNLSKSSKINVGQTLIVKNTDNTYIVKKGDTIWNLANRFNLTIDEFKELNQLNDNTLKIGQKVIIAKKRVPTENTNNSSAQLSEENPTINIKDQSPQSASITEDLTKLSVKERIITFAKKMLHFPYKFGGNSAFGIDCSAYVQKVYSTIGIKLPRSAREQFLIGQDINKEDLSVGDLVFFRTYASFPSHVGIYLGNNLFIHASSKSKRVTIDSLEAPYYAKRFIGAKRLISDNDIDIRGVIFEN